MLSCHCERSAAIQGTPFHYSGLLRCARKDAVHARKDGPTGPWSASVDEILPTFVYDLFFLPYN